MRKFFLHGCIALLAYQFVGFFSFVEIEHYFIRKEIKKALKLSVPENQLVSLHFTAKESKRLHWVKPHEFRLNGHFYDVIYKTKMKGVWHFKCIDDIQESTLFQKLNSYTAFNLVSSSPNHPVHGWIKLMNDPMEPTPHLHYAYPQLHNRIQKVQFQYINHYLTRDLAILAPPPEVMI